MDGVVKDIECELVSNPMRVSIKVEGRKGFKEGIQLLVNVEKRDKAGKVMPIEGFEVICEEDLSRIGSYKTGDKLLIQGRTVKLASSYQMGGANYENVIWGSTVVKRIMKDCQMGELKPAA
jgi:hypothetical protein